MRGLKELNIENLNSLDFNIQKYIIKDNLYETLRSKKFYESLGLKFAIIYNYDSVNFGKIEELEFDIDNVMEARFFDEFREIFFINDNGNIKGNIVEIEKDKKSFIDEKFCVYGNKKYKTLNIKKLVNYDEDGAAYLYYTKPCSFEEGK